MIYWADVDDDGRMSVGRALAELALALADGDPVGGAPSGAPSRAEAPPGPPVLPAPRRRETRPTIPGRR